MSATLITYQYTSHNKRKPKVTQTLHLVIQRDPVDWLMRVRREDTSGRYVLLNAFPVPWSIEDEGDSNLDILRDNQE